MNTTNQFKATARPWSVQSQRPTMINPEHRIIDAHGLLVAQGRAAGGPLKQATENAVLIVKAVNAYDPEGFNLNKLKAELYEAGMAEHAALVAVAEAAKKFRKAFNSSNEESIRAALEDMYESLANLEGGAK